MNAVELLFVIAAVLFGIDFLLGWAGDAYGRYRVNALAWCLAVIALLLWHSGK